MDLATARERLHEWEERYQEWAAPINQVIQEGLRRVNRDGYTAADLEPDVRRVRDEQLALYDPFRHMNALFDELCPAYLDAMPQERDEIRSAVSDKAGVLSALLGYVYRSASRIQSPADGQWLRLGLAAASIENCCRDYRDALLAWAELYVAAEAAGLDPKPAFREVSRLSSREKPVGGTTPVSRMLAGFHRYGVLKERQHKEQTATSP